VLRICGPGDLIGYDEDTPESVAYVPEAIDPVRVCQFEKKEFRALQQRSPRIGDGIIRTLCRMIRFKNERIQSLEVGSVKSRVALLLLSLNSKFGMPTRDGGSEINLEIDRKTIATLAGTVTETLSRTLSELEDEGLIRRENRKIILLSVSKLKKLNS
jgi:CRP/FNR family transcriptional regulator